MPTNGAESEDWVSTGLMKATYVLREVYVITAEGLAIIQSLKLHIKMLDVFISSR